MLSCFLFSDHTSSTFFNLEELKGLAGELNQQVLEGKLNSIEAAKSAKLLQLKLKEMLNSDNPDLDKAAVITKMLVSTLPVLELPKLRNVVAILKPILVNHKLDKPDGNEASNVPIAEMLELMLNSLYESEGFSDKFQEIAKIQASILSDHLLNSEEEYEFLKNLKLKLLNNPLEEPVTEVPDAVLR